MKRKIILTLVLLAVGLVFAQAVPVETPVETTNPLVIAIDTISLFFLLLTTFFAWELYKMMKGGQLATSWGFITVGIFAFSFGRLIDAGVAAGFWDVPEWFDSGVNLVVAIMLAIGVLSQRKVLS